MREALARAYPAVDVRDGTAETIPVGDAGADAVVAAQAFHWFDGNRALAEIHRVLTPNGRLGLVWNERDERPAWAKRITAIIARLVGDGPRYRTMASGEPFERTELFEPLHHRSVERERVTGEILEILDSVPDLTGRATILVPYRADVFWAERR